MGVHSGKFGVVNNQKRVRNWVINDLTTPAVAIHSGTNFGRVRTQGISDWNGSFAQYQGEPVVMPGETFAFSGYTAPSDDVYGSDGKIYAGNAIVDSVVITWNWQANENLSLAVNFSANGPLVVSDGFHDDTTVELPQSACPLKIQTGVALAEVDWENITQAVLTITADNQTYVNSSTNCQTQRVAGPIDWNLAITEQEEDQLYALSSDHRILLFTDATAYWELEWGHIVAYNNLTVDRQTGAIISKVCNIAMNGSDGTSLGVIKKPSETLPTSWWPVAATP
jgi:hypothetical protein